MIHSRRWHLQSPDRCEERAMIRIPIRAFENHSRPAISADRNDRTRSSQSFRRSSRHVLHLLRECWPRSRGPDSIFFRKLRRDRLIPVQFSCRAIKTQQVAFQIFLASFRFARNIKACVCGQVDVVFQTIGLEAPALGEGFSRRCSVLVPIRWEAWHRIRKHPVRPASKPRPVGGAGVLNPGRTTTLPTGCCLRQSAGDQQCQQEPVRRHSGQRLSGSTHHVDTPVCG